MSRQTPRDLAVRLLQHRSGGDFLEDILEAALARTLLPPADRHLCQELVYGIVRWQATLDWLIGRKTDQRPQKPLLQNLLRLGLYQIFWLDRIPNHAAVHETVELAKRNRLGAQAGFLNAVLRGYLREFDATKALLAELRTSQPALGYSHPDWLVSRWQDRWGVTRTAELLAWNNVPPKTYARVNLLKADPAKLLEQWREEEVAYDFFRADWLDENQVFILKSHPPLNRLPSFQQGLFYVQDPSTLLAVRELAPRRGEAVLDLCAAPGGKLTFMAQLLGNEGRLVAHDTAPERLRLVADNCARLGVSCVKAVSALADLAQRPGVDAWPRFDRILIDAPCSNTGVMRRRVDLRWRIRLEEIGRLRSSQVDLLRQAAPLLSPGGTLVYSTCSLEPEENEQVVRQFLAENPHFNLERTRELLPFVEGVDGAYVARFRRG